MYIQCKLVVEKIEKRNPGRSLAGPAGTGNETLADAIELLMFEYGTAYTR
jgi:hypothetical protein